MTPCCKGPCGQGDGTCATPARCQTDSALPPALSWLVREIAAALQLPRWYRTNRKHGFSRTRAAFLAWRTTRPITSTPPRTP
jgi:hypothetical protein